MSFVHLHTHSHYTLLTALPKVDALLKRAKENGMSSIALTDTSNLYGAIELYTHAKDYGIKPIIGAEIWVGKDLHSKTNTSEDRWRTQLVLIAENEIGYKNLIKIISIAQLEGFYYRARADKALLRQYHEGIIALSGSLQGEIPSEIIYGNYERAKIVALEYQEIFGKDNFFLEIQPHFDYENQVTANQGLVQISRETGIPLVATNDVHYLDRSDAAVQDVLLCIRDNKRIDDRERFSMMSLDLSFHTAEAMTEFFKDIPEAIENTGRIADRVNVNIELGRNHLPHFPLPDGITADDRLRELCEEGLTHRYGEDGITAEHRERMEYELDVIKKTGFASYFLIVADFVLWAKQNGVVVGPGRGSAAGSLVAYLTQITNLDPIEYVLLFERFLNPERISMPDVDMDFADDRRGEVLEYVKRKYGEDHVAQIITFGTMAARGSIRDVGRALGIPLELCDRTAKMIPMFSSINEALEEAPELKVAYAEDPTVKRLIDSAKQIEGLARHASVHACGVIISKHPLTEYTPLQRVAGREADIVTQYGSSTKANAVEKIGLLKMDFLGLKNLTIMQNTLRIIRALGKMDDLAHKIGIDPKEATVSTIMDRIPLDDPDTYTLLQAAHTTGVFQLESNGMKRYLKQLKPSVFEDIIAMVALYRPGPMDWIPDFIDGKHGRKQVEYLHPKLEPILRNTYGVAVYQEQVMQIARDLAGFTMGEADVLRKAMGKKIKELIVEQREKFIDGCVKNGIKKDVAGKVFDFIEPFAGYGFNRSHAACYALIGYQTAFLKAHYPAAFMAALLTSDQHDLDRVAIEVREAKEIGIETLPPSINESFEEFAVVTDENGEERIRFGLNAIKNVGEICAREIVAIRKQDGKFTTLEDFIERVQTKDLNKRSLEALAKVGALDDLGERARIIASLDAIIRHSKNTSTIAETHSQSLFGGMNLSKPKIPMATGVAEATKKQKLLWEKELLGLYVSDHPVTEYADYLGKVAIPIHTLDKHQDGEVVRIGGVIASVRKAISKTGQPMFFIAIEDLTGRAEFLVFGKVAERTSHLWIEDELVIITSRINHKNGDMRLMADSAEPVANDSLEKFARVEATRKKNESSHADAQPEAPSNRIVIELVPTADTKTLENLLTTLHSLPVGPTKIFVKIYGSVIETTFSIDATDEVIAALSAVPDIVNVVH